MSEYKRKSYYALDIVKFICALLIICCHYTSETQAAFPQPIKYLFSLYIIAVPFFFICSGYLFFDKYFNLDDSQKKEYLKNYIKRILLMYLSWSVIYVGLRFIAWGRQGILLQRLPSYLHTILVYSTYETIWFLPALAFAVFVACLLFKRLSIKKVIVIVVVLYIIGAFLSSYRFLIKNIPVISNVSQFYIDIFKTSRNGLFNGLPFIVLGGAVAANKESGKKPLVYLLLTGVFGVLFIGEALVIKRISPSSSDDFIFFIVPFVYCLLKLCLSIELKEHGIYVILRKLSILIFVCQRLYLSALPPFFPSLTEKVNSNPYIGLCVVIALTVCTSLILIALSKKFKFFKLFTG